MQYGIKYGAMYGLASVLISLVMYLINKEWLVASMAMLAIAFVVATVFMVLAAKAAKEANEGILTYGEAVITTFLVLFVGMLFSGLFVYVLYNFIDPSMVDLTREKSIEMAEKVIGMMGGGNEDAIDQMREQMEEQDFSMGIGSVLISWLSNSIFGLIYSLIIAAIVKKNPELS